MAHARFIEEHDLSSDRAILRLVLLATLIIPDIVRIECLHASVRRLVESKSLNTHKVDLERLSAEWVAQQYRHRPGIDQPEVREVSIGGDRKRPREQHDSSSSGGGGLWRAYVSTAAEGTTRDFADLGQRYRTDIAAMEPEKLVKLQELAKAATLAHREGSARPFGPTSRDVQVAVKKRQIRSHLQLVEHVADEGESNRELARNIASLPESSAELMRLARVEAIFHVANRPDTWS